MQSRKYDFCYMSGAQLARVQRVHLHPWFFGNSLLETKKMEVLHKQVYSSQGVCTHSQRILTTSLLWFYDTHQCQVSSQFINYRLKKYIEVYNEEVDTL